MAGKPLESGNIVFQPTERSGDVTPVAGTIRDGAYSIPRAEGPVPGSYRVSITSPQPDTSRPVRPGLSADDGGEPPMKETISPRQNAKTELKASVESGGSNTFDFTVDPAK